MKITQKAAQAIAPLLKNNMIIRIKMEESTCCKKPVTYIDVKKEQDEVEMIENLPVVLDNSAKEFDENILIDLVDGQVLTRLASPQSCSIG